MTANAQLRSVGCVNDEGSLMSSRWSYVLIASALVAGVFEFVNAFFLEVPALAVVFGVLYVFGAVWLVRAGGLGACVLIGLLNVVELAFMPAYTWNTASDVVVQGSFAVVAAVGLVASVVVGRERLSLRRHDAGLRSA